MMHSPFDPFYNNFMFSILPMLVTLGFIVVIVLVFIRVMQGAVQWGKNNTAIELTVEAKVVAKRTAVSRHGHAQNNVQYHGNATTYFASFEVDSGDRMEFRIPDREYGMLAEGDTGKLIFKGTRYISFDKSTLNCS